MTRSPVLAVVLLLLFAGAVFSPALADPFSSDPRELLRQQQERYPGKVILAGYPNLPMEYLIVCPAGFRWQIALAPLVNFHLSRGTRTGVRFVGVPVTREEIRTVIRNEFDRGDGTLRFVLLVGDANDHQYPSYWGCPCQSRYDIIPMGEYISKDDIPDGRFSRWSHYIPTDWPYVDFDADDLPDIAIGRFPVRTPGELTRIIEKTLEATRRIEIGGEFLNHVGVWCQDQSGNGNPGELIGWYIDEIVVGLPGQLIVDRLDKSVLKTYENGETAAIGALREGRGVILSMGTACATHNWHGFLDTMRGFEWSDIRLRMSDSPLLPFALVPGADLGNIDQTESKYAPHLGTGRPMMEEALLTPYAGPWAVFAPTRGSWGGGSMLSIVEFMRAAYDTGTPSAGWAAVSAVTNVSLEYPEFRDFLRSLVFLGDPALPLPGQVFPPGEAEPTGSPANWSQFKLRGANPARDHVILEYDITRRAHIEISIYDVRGRKLARLVDEVKEPGSYVFDWSPWAEEGAHLVPGVYFARMRTDGLDPQAERFLLLR